MRIYALYKVSLLLQKCGEQVGGAECGTHCVNLTYLCAPSISWTTTWIFLVFLFHFVSLILLYSIMQLFFLYNIQYNTDKSPHFRNCNVVPNLPRYICFLPTVRFANKFVCCLTLRNKQKYSIIRELGLYFESSWKIHPTFRNAVSLKDSVARQFSLCII